MKGVYCVDQRTAPVSRGYTAPPFMSKTVAIFLPESALVLLVILFVEMLQSSVAVTSSKRQDRKEVKLPPFYQKG